MTKFRAWYMPFGKYGAMQEMVYSRASHILALAETEPEKYIPEQFAGLKDVNGKDIYVGDILKTKAGLIQIVEQGILEIDREDIINGFYANNLSDEKPHTFSYDDEVIGNVHENPELLGEDK
ncbi:YopX family protein [Lactiplantibacillus plantarum]|uniref:YopX family protein n=1 Tax=Lactiplantibacillus plantarum TaxID=1590 RepID=UPI002012981B|nr:YopX family protein [Lactiplantibacillus plantarum]